MHPFVEMISIVGAIAVAFVGAIVVLTLFYRGLAWLSGDSRKAETVAIRGVLRKDTLADVHLGNGETFERVRFIGFTNSEGVKTHLPYELNGMVILEDEAKTRFLVRAKNIRMIVIAPDTADGPK